MMIWFFRIQNGIEAHRCASNEQVEELWIIKKPELHKFRLNKIFTLLDVESTELLHLKLVYLFGILSTADTFSRADPA
jgi:hypothetical protein